MTGHSMSKRKYRIIAELKWFPFFYLKVEERKPKMYSWEDEPYTHLDLCF